MVSSIYDTCSTSSIFPLAAERMPASRIAMAFRLNCISSVPRACPSRSARPARRGLFPDQPLGKHSPVAAVIQHGPASGCRLVPPQGHALFLHKPWVTEGWLGPVHLALGHVRTHNGYEEWAILSDQPNDLKSFDEFGLRFDIERNFLDDKSAGFQLILYTLPTHPARCRPTRTSCPGTARRLQRPGGGRPGRPPGCVAIRPA